MEVVSCYGNPASSGKEQGRMRMRAGMGEGVEIDLHSLVQGNQYAEVISLHHPSSLQRKWGRMAEEEEETAVEWTGIRVGKLGSCTLMSWL